MGAGTALRFGIAALLTVAIPRASPAAPAATVHRLPPDLARALAAYDRATTRNDTAALAALVADDYVLVNSDGSVQGKSSYLADFLVPGFKVEPYVIESPITKLWGRTALTGGVMRLAWTQDGRRQTRRLRVAHVWVKQDRQWRIAYTQLTRVPE